MSVSKHKIQAKSHILSLLGDELIGSDSLAIFELVKNAYDADAENVTITFFDLNTPKQKILIEDNGHGMSTKIIQDVWLTIGTDFKRGKNRKESKKFKRISFGNKGVGRLAVHKLAKIITLETQAEGEMFLNRLTIDWQKLINSEEYIQDLEVDIENIGKSFFQNGHGTKIILSKLTNDKWNRKALRDLVRKIESIKNPFAEFPNFKVDIKCNDVHEEWIKDIKSSIEILKDSLYQFDFEIDFWRNEKNEILENDLAEFRWGYNFNPPSELKLSSAPIFKKNKSNNKINSNQFNIGELYKEIDGEENYSKYLRNKDIKNIGAIKGKFYVFNQSSALLKPKFGGQINAVKEYIKENCGVKLFRDDIRVYNYGESFDDWLGLDLDKIQRTGDHFGKKVTLGFVELDLKSSNEGLIEKTNREGFTDNYTYQKFSLLVKAVYAFFERESSKNKDDIQEYIDEMKPVKKIGFGDTILDLKEIIEQKNLTQELKPLIDRVDKDYIEMRDIMVNSGVTGLNLGVAFHEIDRMIHFINSDLNAKDVNVEDIKNKVKNLMQILENLSPLLRQNKTSSTNAFNVVERAKQININRFGFHNIIFSSPLLSNENPNFNFKGPANLLIGAISNLIDNALYWTTSKRDLLTNEKFKPAIYIGTDLDSFEGPAIIIVDNGSGFTVEPELLTQPFKTKKEGGMGLGLYFTDLVMNMMGGKLIFPDNSDLDIPKSYDGACIALIFPKKQ